MITSILVPYDGSQSSVRALELAGDIAAKYKASLTALHVVTGGKVPSSLEHFAEIEHLDDEDVPMALGERLLEDADRIARRSGAATVTTLRSQGDPASEILGKAADGIDLIVIGSRGLGELRGLLLGSVSHKVTQLAKCACITVR